VYSRWQFMVVILLFCGGLPAEMTEEQQVRLLQALSGMSAAPLAAESREVCEHVAREDLDLEARTAFLDRFYQDHVFTEHLGYNLENHILYSTADQGKMARFAGSVAAAALRNLWESAALAGVKPNGALPFLESVFNKGTVSIRDAVTSGIQDVLGAHPLELASFLTPAAPHPLEATLEAMQSCITLGVYATKKEYAAWFKLPDTTATFFDRTRVWLFDGQTLSSEHRASLESLFAGIPVSLHGVIALQLPESTGFSAENTTLRVPGISLDVPLIAMEVLRELPVYDENAPLTVIPEFTGITLERLSAAVHTRQFGLRPDVYQRMRTFFTIMEARPDPALLSIFPPEVFRLSPEERMAYLGYLWLANSRRLLETAITQVEQQQARPPLYALLLEADIWSELSDATLLFRTNPAGVLTNEKAALRRGGASGALHVNGIAFSGRIWQYEMGDLAGMPVVR